MEGLELPILIALSVTLLVWSVAHVALAGVESNRRRIQERLARGNGGLGAGTDQVQSITLDTEATGLSAVLVRWSPLEGLHRQLLRAYPEVSLAGFLGLAAGIALFVFVLVGLLLDSAVMGVIAAGLAGYAPFLVLGNKRFARQRVLAGQLPEALDFLSRTLKAGHSLSTGLQMLGEELPQPLASEFRRCYEQHSLGVPLEEALKDMAARIESTDFAFFITAVLIQRQTGGDLSQVLDNISSMIRQRIRLEQHVKAKTAEGRLTGYVLVAFPVLMFMISYGLNPEQAGIMLHTTIGLSLLGLTVVLEALGLYAIRKITNLRV